MSLHKFADMVAKQGRGDDSLLIHMTPDEVQRLQKFAEANGRSLTINPTTGLPEAGMLSDLFKAVAPIALGAFLGPGAFGIAGLGLSAGTAGLVTGGLTTLATGSLSRGLMAGLGAYGGAGMAEGLAGTGAGVLGQKASEATAMELMNAGAGEGLTGEAYNQAFQQSVTDKMAALTPEAKMAAGLDVAKASPMDYLKNNWQPLAAAAAPIMAGAMVPTTTSMPTSGNTGFVRQKIVNPDGTVRDLTPVKASEWGSRNFSDVYRGYNGGGIVALAEGGAAPAINSVEDLYTNILGRAPDTEGLAFWKQGFGDTIDANEIASFKNAAQAELANRSAPEQQILAPNLVNTAGAGAAATSVADLYQGILGRAPESADVTNYWQNQFGDTIDANELAQFKTAAQTELDARNAGTTGGGVANLATTGAGTTAGGIADLTGGTTGGTSLADAQTAVNNIYRNVLGRDADPTGLNFWSNAIANGRSVDSVYQDILKSANEIKQAGTLGDFGIKTLSTAEATKPYTGYTSAASDTVADEWVRNVLGREPTAAEKAQSWYKDAANLQTPADAAKVYKDFKDYAAAAGKKTDLSWMEASQLKALPTAKPVINNTFDSSTAVSRQVTNPYGNVTNPGDLTYNQNGTITVAPNIPYRPYGGFSGMGEVKNAYTQGGGSLGYTAKAPRTMEEFNQLYNKQTGDSLAAYNYLMGKGAYPTKSGVGEISRPYREATLGYPESTNKMYNWDPVAGKMVRNPDYVAPGRDASGNVTYGMSLNDIKKYLTAEPLQGQALYDWAKTNNLSAEDIAAATGMKLSDVYAQFRTGQAAAAKTAADKTAAETVVAEADGGVVGYAVGGGLGSLGSYSDGGRLLRGPGDGVSDSIPATIGAKQQPARLADGEFVVPARIVSELGNGSTDAGAKKLYAMMDRVQRARGKTTGKNKVAANSRADKYLPA